MEEKKFTTVKPSDLTVQDRWDILRDYVDFSARFFTLRMMATDDPKQKNAEMCAASTMLAIKALMSSDENLIKALHEMSIRGMSDLIKSVPIPSLEDLTKGEQK